MVARLLRIAALLFGSLALSGCLPSVQSQFDEEKEAHFMEGKSRVNAMDYKGAIESFEKAVEANSQSASAHFELAWLYDQKEADPAAAIYHYERYLRLRPAADNAEVVKQHVLACKQELARAVSLGPVGDRVQRELEQLAEENRRLREKLEELKVYATRLQLLTNPPTPGVVVLRAVAPAGGGAAALAGSGAGKPEESGRSSRVPASVRYVVKPGETMSLIARSHGIKVEALVAANPGANPRRLRVGQALNLPVP